MKKITFTPHAYREGFQLIADGIAMVARETAKRVDNAAHRWPYAFMLVEAAKKVASQIRDIFKNSKAE